MFPGVKPLEALHWSVESMSSSYFMKLYKLDDLLNILLDIKTLAFERGFLDKRYEVVRLWCGSWTIILQL